MIAHEKHLALMLNILALGNPTIQLKYLGEKYIMEFALNIKLQAAIVLEKINSASLLVKYFNISYYSFHEII